MHYSAVFYIIGPIQLSMGMLNFQCLNFGVNHLSVGMHSSTLFLITIQNHLSVGTLNCFKVMITSLIHLSLKMLSSALFLILVKTLTAETLTFADSSIIAKLRLKKYL